jgi:MFS family permease
VPSPYGAIFSVPGARSFTAAGLISRLPVAMMGLGIVTMVSQLTGAYGLAGALAATVALSVAVFGPQVSRLVDRHGQRRVLRPAAAITMTPSSTNTAISTVSSVRSTRAEAWMLRIESPTTMAMAARLKIHHGTPDPNVICT